jgi:hypothetical protein
MKRIALIAALAAAFTASAALGLLLTMAAL